MNLIRVLIVEDDVDFRYLIERAVTAQSDMEAVGCCGSRLEAVAAAQAERPDLVLMDLNLSSTGLDGVEAAREIRLATDAKVIILTAFDDPDTVIRASVRAFASGHVFKSQFSTLIPTIRATARGHTPQEYLILTAILAPLSPAERAVFDGMMGKKAESRSSAKTIANQKTGIFRKLGLKNQKELNHIFRPPAP